MSTGDAGDPSRPEPAGRCGLCAAAHVDLIPVIMRCLCHDIVHLAELVRVDVVEAAHRVTAAVGQSRVDRCRNAVGSVVRRSHRQIVCHTIVASRIVIVTSGQRDAGSQLPLHFRREVPVVRTVAETRDHIRRPDRRDVGPSEVRVRDRSAFTVGREVRQVTVGEVIVVGIVPGACGAVHRGCDRIVERGNIGPGDAHVAAHRDFQGRPPIPEQVVRCADPGVQVLPARHALHRPEVACGGEASGRDVLGGHAGVEVVEPQTVIEREALDDPLILSVDAQVTTHSFPPQVRRRKLNDLIRHAPQEHVIDITVDFLLSIRDALLLLHSYLERMGSGDIGHREPLNEAGIVQTIAVNRRCVVPERGRALED